MKKIMTEEYELIDNEESRRYEFRIDGHIAKIEYIKTPNGEIYLTHTEVPRALGGKGVGSQLVEKALKDIEQKIYALCHFVRSLPATFINIRNGDAL